MKLNESKKKEIQKWRKHIQECVERNIIDNVPRELVPYLNNPIIKFSPFNTYRQKSSAAYQLYWSVAKNRSGRFFAWSTVENQWVDLGGPVGQNNPTKLIDPSGNVIETFEYTFSPENVFSTKEELLATIPTGSKNDVYLIGAKNRVIDFLRLNLYSQFSVGFNSGPEKYLPGISRIACHDLGFYSFSYSVMRGGDISKLAKYMNILAFDKNIIAPDIEIDEDLNGWNYDELSDYMGRGYERFKKIEDEKLSSYQETQQENHTYTIIPIQDQPAGDAGYHPVGEGLEILRELSNYVDWCICTDFSEFAQYTGNGGKFYVCLRDDYKNVKKPENKNNNELDDYGLSMISVLVGVDGYPDLITTRWNHNYGGENNKDLWAASQLQNITGINYKETFKPRNSEELRRANLSESKTPSAQDQVKNKVNAGVMDGVFSGCMALEEEDVDNSENKKIQELCVDLAKFMYKSGLNIKPYPSVELNWDDQNQIFIKTGYYSPSEKKIVVFCKDRHIKDILRSFAHEMIHHCQNLDGEDLNFSSEDQLETNNELEKIEGDAFLRGNLYFRKWTEEKNRKNGTLNESKRIRRNDEGEVVPDICPDCGSKIETQIKGEPVFVCHKCKKYFGTVKFNVNENTDIEEYLEPDEVDLSSFQIKCELNPKFWKDDRLDSRIRMKLLDIADDFIEYLNVDWVEPEDIILTGSLANYNWNKQYSDIDIHIIYDFSKVDDNFEFVDDYFYSKKKLWNEEHEGLTIYGFPVEMYVEDINNEGCSTGVYSLESDEWKETPNREKLASEKVNKKKIVSQVSLFTKKIDSLIKHAKLAKGDNYKLEKINERANELFDEIKNVRRDCLNNEKREISNGNIIFKTLRRIGYIEKLVNLITKTYEKINSID